MVKAVSTKMEQTNMAMVCGVLYIIPNCNETATNHVAKILFVNLPRKSVRVWF